MDVAAIFESLRSCGKALRAAPRLQIHRSRRTILRMRGGPLRAKRLPIGDNETSSNIFLQTAQIVLAARLRARVLLHHNATKRFAPGQRMIPKSGVRFSDKIMRREGRRSAERRMCQPCPRSINRCCHPLMLSARLRAILGGAPAFRRFTAALATGYYPDGSAPEPGFLKARRARCFARSPHKP